MAQKNYKVNASADYEFKYDPDSNEFKDTLKSYRECIYKNGTERSVILHCAHHFAALGRTCDSMVEGIGYVIKEGTPQKEPFSGITIIDDFPDYDYETI